mmetsp:Transcript_39630/g.115694  ORF Transcript_39630/g.115694 Transcript_39630/m.115694 type:complete len:483 (-) Transcript_39630:382-1830(-)
MRPRGAARGLHAPCTLRVHGGDALAALVLVDLLLGRLHQRRHRDDARGRVRMKARLDGGAEDGALDVAAREFEAFAQGGEVDVRSEGRLLGQELAPEGGARSRVGRGELQHELEAAVEGGVDLHVTVRDRDDDAGEGLHVMEQHTDVEVVVPVGRAAIVGSLSEEALGLVEDQHGVLRLGFLEDLLDVLGALAYILVDQLGAVDDQERSAHVEADRLGRHRLSGARWAVEERRDALRLAVGLLEAPLAKEHGLRLLVVDHLPQLVLDRRGQHHLLEAVARHDAAVKVGHRQAAAQLMRRALVQVCLRHRRREALARDGEGERGEPRVLDEAARQLVLARERHVVDVGGELELGRVHRAPDALAQQLVGPRELDRERDAPVHRLVQVHRPVGGEHAEALVALELGEYGVDLHVSLGAVHEDRLALVKEEHGVVYLGLAEDELEHGARRVGAQLREVDHEHLLVDELGEGVGHHRLAGARRPVE